jgi:hypothetical protein
MTLCVVLQCKYDYSTTLSKEFAVYTKYYQDQFINIYEGVLKPEARVSQDCLFLFLCTPLALLNLLLVFSSGDLMWSTGDTGQRAKINVCLHTRHHGQVRL